MHTCVLHQGTKDTGDCNLHYPPDTDVWALEEKNNRLKDRILYLWKASKRAVKRILTLGLAQRVINCYRFNGLPGIEKLNSMGTRGFVSTAERLRFAICPVDEVFKQGQPHHTLDVTVRNYGRNISQKPIFLSNSHQYCK